MSVLDLVSHSLKPTLVLKLKPCAINSDPNCTRFYDRLSRSIDHQSINQNDRELEKNYWFSD